MPLPVWLTLLARLELEAEFGGRGEVASRFLSPFAVAFRDGEWRARCRRVLSATGFGLCVAAVAAVLIEACARFGARACGGGSADRVWRRARGGGEGGGGFGSVGPVSAALKAA